MLNDIYNQKILEFAGNVPLLGHLEAPHGMAKAHSRLCGSTVSVEVCLEGDHVCNFAQDVKACALGQASAAILGRHVIGASRDELVKARDALKAMLKEGGSPPEGRFHELAFLEPVKDYKARHASTMLAFEAVVEAVEKAQTSAQAGV
ncbi:iron-sulfur cluster assembly scaffold protein [Pseudovibrio exalbescens]|uniref:Iron-sulfur cluster assembly scaffold protein n=1 Tax=Pseudovibrio exalbescens TaxID=197461 RepID=A0A1U7JKJ0_9HYPH|nr:iron-sulfur cluster assembly scaffold protein [Pseudovibrio exalbescens]OKL45212.1 iron-sulfur cluster assembly scaffold protein [Pseudovibrio exalbescens]